MTAEYSQVRPARRSAHAVGLDDHRRCADQHVRLRRRPVSTQSPPPTVGSAAAALYSVRQHALHCGSDRSAQPRALGACAAAPRDRSKRPSAQAGRTKQHDRFVVIGGNGDAIFKRLMGAIGRADMAQDERCLPHTHARARAHTGTHRYTHSHARTRTHYARRSAARRSPREQSAYI